MNYIESEQKNTKINFSKKIKSINSVRENDIIINIDDISKINNNDFRILTNLSDFIYQSKITSPTSFKIENLTFNIKALNTYEHKLVSTKSDYYLDKCI